MCRQYKFRFLECGHDYSNPTLELPAGPPPTRLRDGGRISSCEVSTALTVSQKKKCLPVVEISPMSQRLADLSLAGDRLNRILTTSDNTPTVLDTSMQII